MSDFLYEVGDEYQGSPVLMSKFISEVLAVGGLVEIDGDIARIIYLPGSVKGEHKVIDKYKDPEPKAETIEDTQASIDQIEKFNEEVEDPESEGTDAVAINISGEYEEILHTSDQGTKEADVENTAAVEALENEGGAVVEAPKPAKRGRPRKTDNKE